MTSFPIWGSKTKAKWDVEIQCVNRSQGKLVLNNIDILNVGDNKQNEI